MWLIQTLFVIVFIAHQAHVHATDLTDAATLDPPKLISFQCKYEKRFALISWEPPSNTSIVKNYVLEFKATYAPDEWAIFFDKISSIKTSYEVSMKPGVTFQMRLIVRYIGGKSSQPSESTEMCTTKPDVPYINPTNIKVKAVPPSDLIVSWEKMPQYIHHGPDFCYVIYWKNGTNHGNKITITDWKQEEYVIKNVHSRKYEIDVIAGNSLGRCKAIPHTVIGYPGVYEPKIDYFNCHDNQLDISWTHPGKLENIDSYTIEYSTSLASTTWRVLLENINETSHMIPLNPGVTFSFRVIVKYTDVKPNQISEITERCKTNPDVPYTNPTSVYIKRTSLNELLILWKPVPELEHNGFGYFYRIYYRKAGLDWSQETITNWAKDRYILEYSPSEKYEIKVIAGNRIGESNAKAIVFNILPDNKLN